MIMSNEFMTQHEAERNKRNASIIADFDALRGQNPDTSDWRIMGLLSKRYHVSTQTIRNVVRK